MPTADAALAPPVAFHFTVSFGSTPPAVDGSFQEVSGIAPELEADVRKLRRLGQKKL